VTALLALLLLAGRQPAKPAATPRPTPPPAIVHVAVELPDADHAKLRLRAKGPVGPPAPLASQQLFFGELSVPLEGAPDLALLGDGFEASFTLPLARIPEKVLELDPHAMPVRFEARDSAGKAVFVAAGKLDLGDPGVVAIPAKRAYELYARLDRLAFQPSLASVAFSALLSFYNPLAFPITVRHLEYRVLAGHVEVLAASRPGFRLRPRQRSDVLVEQEIPLAALGAAASAALGQQNLTIQGQIVIQTPSGDRPIPLILGP